MRRDRVTARTRKDRASNQTEREREREVEKRDLEGRERSLVYSPDAADCDRMSCREKTVYLRINKEQVHTASCEGNCTMYLRRHARKRRVLCPYNSRWTSQYAGYPSFFFHFVPPPRCLFAGQQASPRLYWIYGRLFFRRDVLYS